MRIITMLLCKFKFCTGGCFKISSHLIFSYFEVNIILTYLSEREGESRLFECVGLYRVVILVGLTEQ